MYTPPADFTPFIEEMPKPTEPGKKKKKSKKNSQPEGG
jgi:hypothetical protein